MTELGPRWPRERGQSSQPAPAVGGQMKEVYSVGPSLLGHRKFRSAPNVTAGALWLGDSLAPWPRGATSASLGPSLAVAPESHSGKEASRRVLLGRPCSRKHGPGEAEPPMVEGVLSGQMT